MAKELLPDALWARIAALLPLEPPKPKGVPHPLLARQWHVHYTCLTLVR